MHSTPAPRLSVRLSARWMSESDVACPLCERPVGGVHDDFCPRSAAVMRDHHAKSKIRPVHFWSKGPLVVRLRGERAKVTFNPGIPYVRQTGGKSWKAGGVPIGADDAVKNFKRSLGMKEGK